MAEQHVRTVFTGDSRGAVRSAREVRAELEQMTRGAIAGSGAFHHLGRAMAFASGAFIGASAVTLELRDMIKASKEQGAVTALVSQQMRNLGMSYQVSRGRIDEYLTALRKTTGFQDNEMMRVLAQQLRATGNLDEALRRVSVATDIARGRNIDLNTSSMLLIRGGMGLTGMLRRLGIEIKPVTDNMDALTKAHDAAARAAAANGDKVTKITADQRAHAQALDDVATRQKVLTTLQQTYAGQAAAYGRTAAGAADKFSAAWEHAQEVIGERVLPVLARELNKFTDALNAAFESGRLQNDLNRAGSDLRAIAVAADQVARAVGGWRNAFDILLTGFLASKINALAMSFKLLAFGEGAAGAGGIAAAVKQVGLLRLGLLALTRVGPVAVPVAIDLSLKNDWIKNHLSFKGFLDALVGKKHLSAAEWAKLLLLGIEPKPDSAATGQTGKGTVVDTLKGGVQLPTTITPTHQTAGLAGFPAVDIMAKPGTPIRAPEDGAITRISGQDPSASPPNGQGGPWGLSIYYIGRETGTTYYMTHLMKVALPGNYRKGDVIGLIGDYPGSKADHVHFAVHPGDSAEAHYGSIMGLDPSRVLGSPRGSTGPPTTTTTTKPTTTKFPTVQTDFLPLVMRQALADAQLTPGRRDDLVALGQARMFLEALRGRSGGAKRLGVTEELGGIVDQIRQLGGLKPASKTAIGHTELAVQQLQRRLGGFAGLDKTYGPQLDALDKELRAKVVSRETLAEIGLRLAQLRDKITVGIDKAKAAVAARKQAFEQEWTKLAQGALDAFDKATGDYVSPTRAIINAVTKGHEQADLRYAVDQAKQAVDEAQKAVADAMAGTVDDASTTLDAIRQLVGRYGLADQIDIVQAGILGGAHVSQIGVSFLGELQQLLANPSRTVDAQAVTSAKRQLADAQHSLDEAVYQQKLSGLEDQATLEEQTWADRRARERQQLQDSLDDWGRYFEALGHNAKQAVTDFNKTIIAMGHPELQVNATGTPLASFLPANVAPADLAKTLFGNPYAGMNAGQVQARILGELHAAGVPGYAGGGIAWRPTLATVGEREPELIMPLSKIRGGDGASTPALNVYVSAPNADDWIAGRVTVEVQRQTSAIDQRLGQIADLRRRAGRS